MGVSTPILQLRQDCRKRARSVPKNMGSRKDEWESACHMLGYQHCPVEAEVAHNIATRLVTVQKHGCELGLNVLCDGDALLVNEVGPGPIQSWNELHPDEAVAPGDRITEVNGITGAPADLLQACCEADMLMLVVQSFGQATARSQSSESGDSFGSAPELSLLSAMDMCGMPLETPTLDRYMPAFDFTCKEPVMPTYDQQDFGDMCIKTRICNEPHESMELSIPTPC